MLPAREQGGYSGGFTNGELQPGDVYTLQISVEGVPVVPEPASWAMTVAGLVGWVTRALRRRQIRALRFASLVWCCTPRGVPINPPTRPVP